MGNSEGEMTKSIGFWYPVIKTLLMFQLHFAVVQILFVAFGASYVILAYIFIAAQVGHGVFEIPCGVLADKWGRKKTSLVGLYLSCGGFLLAFFAQSPWWFVVAWFLAGVGGAFISGSLEAAVYKMVGSSKAWSVVRTRADLYSIIFGGIAGVLGALFYYQLGLFIFLISSFFTLLAALLVALFVEESGGQTNRIVSFGVVKKYASLILLFAFLLAPFATFSLLIRQLFLVEHGFSVVGVGAILGSLLIVGALTSRFLARYMPQVDIKRGFLFVLLLQVFGFLFSLFLSGIWVLLPLVLLYVGFIVGKAWQSVYLNARIEESYRASILSVVAFSNMAILVVLLFLGGLVLNTFGMHIFLFALFLLSVVILLWTQLLKIKSISILT